MGLLADGTKQIALSREQFEAINSPLKNFYQRVKCGAILLADASGLLVARQGNMDPTNLPVLSALAAADFAATGEMARLIGESCGFSIHFHQGETNNIYIKGVGEEFFLVVIFSNQTTFGMVRVLADKIAEELSLVVDGIGKQDPAAPPTNGVPAGMNDSEFRNELSSRLDSVLFGNKGSN